MARHASGIARHAAITGVQLPETRRELQRRTMTPLRRASSGSNAENDDPQPQVPLAFGLLNLKPEAWSSST